MPKPLTDKTGYLLAMLSPRHILFANLFRDEEYMYDENPVHSGSKGDRQKILEKNKIK